MSDDLDQGVSGVEETEEEVDGEEKEMDFHPTRTMAPAHDHDPIDEVDGELTDSDDESAVVPRATRSVDEGDSEEFEDYMYNGYDNDTYGKGEEEDDFN